MGEHPISSSPNNPALRGGIQHQCYTMMLMEHLVRCETGSVHITTPWYKNCIERLQQIFLMHHVTIQQ
ncbi:unnamed protein product [Lota lota]